MTVSDQVRKAFSRVLGLAVLMASALAVSAEFPAYYPDEGFERVGRIDDVLLDESRVVINDMSFALADNVIVHTPTTYAVPRERLRVGIQVGYRLSGSDTVAEIWMLPRGATVQRGRGGR